MIRDQEIQLADERRFDRREIGDVENKVAKACDRGVARREPVAKMGIGVELEMQPAAGLAKSQRRAKLQFGRFVGVEPRRRNAFGLRSEEHTTEPQSLLRNSKAVFCMKNKK